MHQQLYIFLLATLSYASLDNFIKTHFADNTIFFIFTEELNVNLTITQSIIMFNVTKRFEEFGSEYEHKKINYFLIVRNEENLEFIIKKLILNQNYNTKQKHLIFVEEDLDAEGIKRCFELMWQHDIYNIAVTTKGNTNVSTWYPYQRESNCGKNIIIETNAIAPFNDKIPKIFTNCKIKLSWKEHSLLTTNPRKTVLGFSNQMLLLIGNKSGLIMEFEQEENQLIYKELYNRTQTVELAEYVIKNKIDIIADMYAVAVSKYVDKQLEMSTSCVLFRSLWLLPRKQPLPPFKAFLSALTIDEYLLILFTFLAFMIAYRFLTNSYFDAIRIFLLQPSHSTTNSITKLLLIFGLIFTIHVNFLYSSQLIRVLCRPVYPVSYRTLEEVVEKTELKFSYTANTIEMLQKKSAELWKKIEARTDKVMVSRIQKNWERKKKFLYPKGVVEIGFYDLYYINNPQDLELLEEQVRSVTEDSKRFLMKFKQFT